MFLYVIVSRISSMVKAFAGQADVQRFEHHLGHNWLSYGYNWLSYGVFIVRYRYLGVSLAQTIRPNCQALSAGGSVALQSEVFAKST